MIECPFCNEHIDEEDLVFEFNWGEVAKYFYHRKKIDNEPNKEFKDRAFYVSMKYDLHGRPLLSNCSSVINPQKHKGLDPMCTDKNNWGRIVHLLSGKRIFEVECDDNDKSLPISAKILPLIKHKKRQNKRNRDERTTDAEGVSTGIFCPLCEQQLNSELLKADTEVRILLAGRPGSGKTVFVTQLISELMLGRLAQEFKIRAANNAVSQHYTANKNRLKAFGNGFVLATNPGTVQDPYVYLLSNEKNSIRLIIQDIAGEDAESRNKYSTAVRKADLVLFFIDPWHIEEIRAFHERNDDLSNAIVKRLIGGKYYDLNDVFLQMMSVIDNKFAQDSNQLAGVVLVKGDYLNPPMLSQGSQPECQMMQQPITFNNATEMEFDLAMRSSFIRQCMHEWESTRGFARQVENIYPSRNIRYFVSSSLGQSTHLRRAQSEEASNDTYDGDDPNAQFMVDNSSQHNSDSSGNWDYDEQVLESAARPEHVIDPVFWCLNRKGISF